MKAPQNPAYPLKDIAPIRVYGPESRIRFKCNHFNTSWSESCQSWDFAQSTSVSGKVAGSISNVSLLCSEPDARQCAVNQIELHSALECMIQ